MQPRQPQTGRKSSAGKVVLIIVGLVVLVGIGVLIGWLLTRNSSSDNSTATTNNTTNEVANADNTSADNTEDNATNSDNTTSNTTDNSTTSNSTTNSTPTIPADTTGINVTGKSPFLSYTAHIPNTWSWEKSHVGAATNLTLTRGGFTVVISQSAGGNGTCVYPGDATSSDPMAATFGSPTTVAGVTSTFRIAMQEGAGSAGDKHLLVCEKTTGDYKLATQFGYISVTTPPEGATSDWSKNNASVQSILSLLMKQ